MTFEEELKQQQSLFDSLSYYQIELGIFAGKASRTKSKDITNAEILFINENGSPIRNIPPRPILKISLTQVKSSLVDESLNRITSGILYFNWTKKEIEIELNKLCMRIENYARSIIYDNDGTLKSNAKSTIKKKGFDHPLFITGQLTRSIQCKLVDNRLQNSST